MYGKIFESIYDGTLYGKWEAIATFQQFIVLADKEGIVDMTPPAIAARTSFPLDIIERGIEILLQEDKFSRSDTREGKRIIAIDPNRPWGWEIVNYKQYSKIASRDDKREKDAKRMAEKRKNDKENNNVADCSEESIGVAEVAHVDITGDVDIDINEDVINTNMSSSQAHSTGSPLKNEKSKTKHKKKKSKLHCRTSSVNGEGREFDEVVQVWREVLGWPSAKIDANRKRCIKWALAEYGIENCLKAIDGCSKSSYHMDGGYTDLTLLFRDSSKIEQFIKLSDRPASQNKFQRNQEVLKSQILANMEAAK